MKSHFTARLVLTVAMAVTVSACGGGRGGSIGSGAASDQVSCGLGPPPGSPQFEEHEQLQDRQRASLGYVLLCSESLGRFDYAARVEPLDKATAHLAFTPVSLGATPFAALEALGGWQDYFGSPDGAAGLHRTFRTPQGYIVDLREWDMSVGGGQVMVRADLQTEQVNGNLAQLTVVQAPSGKAVSLLLWVEGRRSYELSTNANVKTTDVSPTIFELATAIPKSVPARLDESEPPLLVLSTSQPIASPVHRQ
jgi:hypothetical protein